MFVSSHTFDLRRLLRMDKALDLRVLDPIHSGVKLYHMTNVAQKNERFLQLAEPIPSVSVCSDLADQQ